MPIQVSCGKPAHKLQSKSQKFSQGWKRFHNFLNMHKLCSCLLILLFELPNWPSSSSALRVPVSVCTVPMSTKQKSLTHLVIFNTALWHSLPLSQSSVWRSSPDSSHLELSLESTLPFWRETGESLSLTNFHPGINARSRFLPGQSQVLKSLLQRP